MEGDTLIIAVFLATLANIVRYISSLRVLLFMMREANPLLYQQVSGDHFFNMNGDMHKQKRLYHYIRSQEYQHHHDEAFIAKCNKVRHLFVLCTCLVLSLIFTLFLVAFTGM